MGRLSCTALLGEQTQQLLHFAHEQRKALPRLATIGARFRDVGKGFYGPDSLPSMGVEAASSEGRSARACLLEVSNLAASRGGGRLDGDTSPKSSASRSRRSGRQSRRNGGGSSWGYVATARRRKCRGLLPFLCGPLVAPDLTIGSLEYLLLILIFTGRWTRRADFILLVRSLGCLPPPSTSMFFLARSSVSIN